MVSWDELRQATLNPAWKKLCPEMVWDFKGIQEVEHTTETSVELRHYKQATEMCEELAQQLELKVDTSDINEHFASHDALIKLELMDPDTEQFENIHRHIYNMSSYKAIYDEKKHVTTQSTLNTFVRCRPQNIRRRPLVVNIRREAGRVYHTKGSLCTIIPLQCKHFLLHLGQGPHQ
ncbi:hypothetical protein PR048_012925 [Dryococelus australis]|uniref:Uncharacterized protein n=1 Tax=Dryococelus australis TaxID=614101 RepID=A0ABQ9HQR1_9NEOP|nr:hypothetical protein PR048_012925 [Dryococelus australis]